MLLPKSIPAVNIRRIPDKRDALFSFYGFKERYSWISVWRFWFSHRIHASIYRSPFMLWSPLAARAFAVFPLQFLQLCRCRASWFSQISTLRKQPPGTTVNSRKLRLHCTALPVSVSRYPRAYLPRSLNFFRLERNANKTAYINSLIRGEHRIMNASLPSTSIILSEVLECIELVVPCAIDVATLEYENV